jgi:hypothetical protein
MKEENQSDRYGYSVHTKKLVRPMGRTTHIGKVTRIVDRQYGVDLRPDDFGESWGDSEQEAREKMHKIVADWIAAQQ